MNKEDLVELKGFVKRYQEIEISIEMMQKSIKSLADKRDSLFDELDEMKDREEEFLKSLVEKYGASEVTPNKLLEHLENDNS